MRWFEKHYDRNSVTESIMTVGPVERVCIGYDRTKFAIDSLKTVCHLNRYAQRNVYDLNTGQWEAQDTPYYMVLLQYTAPDGAPVNARVDFNSQHNMLNRSSEYERRMPERNPDEAPKIWDEAVSAMDEALCAQAKKLGIIVTAPMIERPAEPPKVGFHAVA